MNEKTETNIMQIQFRVTCERCRFWVNIGLEGNMQSGEKVAIGECHRNAPRPTSTAVQINQGMVKAGLPRLQQLPTCFPYVAAKDFCGQAEAILGQPVK